MTLLLWIPLFPLLGFLLNAAMARRLAREISGGIACLAMLAAFAASATAVRRLLALDPVERMLTATAFTWIGSGDLQVPVELRLDPLSAVMILVVSGVGFLIHVYSTAYMHEETPAEHARYFSYLNLFAAFMLLLVLAANLVVLFVGWEGVGLCSYLLIGFWYRKKSAADAGKKAFIVNRIGDVAFILGMLLAFVRFGTFDFQGIATQAALLDTESDFGLVSAIALLLFGGAVGKSAQIPLHVWLPDAMEGPTPVSALIHAATMVTAGVYLIGRNAILFSHAPQVLLVVASVGVATALLAGAIGLVQNDIKRVLAYSTISQLGYMFLAMGVGAYAAGIFHLFTHAFFKALLFLGAGAVIHALAGEQDLRRMGGLRRSLPITYWTFLVGALAIAGVPGLAGFFSKDEILFRTFAAGHPVLWAAAMLGSLLTAIYMFRLVFMAFHGAGRRAGQDGHSDHARDAPPSMAIPLVLLAAGSIAAGYVGVPHALGGANRIEEFLAPSFGAFQGPAPPESEGGGPAAESGPELPLMLLSTSAALAGIGIAAFVYLKRPEVAERLAAGLPGLHRFLVNKGYVDELYDEAVVDPVRTVSEKALWRGVDATIIDGAVNAAGTIVSAGGFLLREMQTGSMRSYALSVLLGVVLIVGYYLWR
jgi:NADH-quinone oxidoreductase subunit L